MRNKKGILPIFAGSLLLAAALLLTGYNLYDEYRAGQSVYRVAEHLEISPYEAVSNIYPGETEVPDYILNPNMDMPVQTVDGVDYIGILEIPSLGLELPVISSWSYPNLKTAPCRYSGSAYTNNFVIAAHNYKSHFGNLKNLSDGEKVIFTDVDGNVFTYEVVLRETLEPTAVEEMTGGGYSLSLFTCNASGSCRLTVRSELITE